MSIREQAEARVRQAYEDMGIGDIEGLMTFFADDVVLQNPGQPPLVGIEAVRAFWSRTLSTFVPRAVPRVEEANEFGDAVVLRGQVVGKMISRTDGVETPVDSWFLQVYRRQPDGTLRFWRGANGPSPS
jgi:ketosteroid isomerase-like protein